MPVFSHLGLDPVHLGLVIVVNLLIGTLTPPFGVLIFVMMEVGNVKYKKLLKAVMPFYIPLFAFLMVLTFVPSLSLFLPKLLLSH